MIYFLHFVPSFHKDKRGGGRKATHLPVRGDVMTESPKAASTLLLSPCKMPPQPIHNFPSKHSHASPHPHTQALLPFSAPGLGGTP